jgi:hypothetical protein
VSHLVFCSFEVGGLPFKIAEALNRHGVETYYFSASERRRGHDTTRFHYGGRCDSWDLSPRLRRLPSLTSKIVSVLQEIKTKYGIENSFATGHFSYLLRYAGIRYQYWSFGSDLDRRAFPPVWPKGHPFLTAAGIYAIWALNRRRVLASLQNADKLMIAPYQFEAYRKICPGKSLFFLPHLLSIEDFATLRMKKEESRAMICARLRAHNFFFSSTRHFWAGRKAGQADNKGNNIILESFAEYLRRSGRSMTKLVLIKKGPDVGASRALAEELGIADRVVWLDQMPRGDLNVYYQGASVCFGQFGTPVVTNAVVEPLGQASACVSYYGEDSSSVPFYKDPPPVMNAKDPANIGRTLADLMADEMRVSELGFKSWRWAKEQCSEERFVNAFRESFPEKASHSG